ERSLEEIVADLEVESAALTRRILELSAAPFGASSPTATAPQRYSERAERQLGNIMAAQAKAGDMAKVRRLAAKRPVHAGYSLPRVTPLQPLPSSASTRTSPTALGLVEHRASVAESGERFAV